VFWTSSHSIWSLVYEKVKAILLLHPETRRLSPHSAVAPPCSTQLAGLSQGAAFVANQGREFPSDHPSDFRACFLNCFCACCKRQSRRCLKSWYRNPYIHELMQKANSTRYLRSRRCDKPVCVCKLGPSEENHSTPTCINACA